MKKIRVEKLLERIKNRGIKAFEGETIEELILHFVDNPDSRIAVVIGKDRRFKGFTTMKSVGNVAFPLMAGADELGYEFFVRILSKRVEDIIRFTNLSVSLKETLDRAVEKMLNFGLEELPVVENGEYIGIITMADILEIWVDKEAMKGEDVE